MSNSLFAFLNLMLVGTLIRTAVIVFFDFLQLRLIQVYLGSSTIVYQIDRDSVPDGFGHGIGIHHRAKNLNRGINRCSGEANISRIRQ